MDAMARAQAIDAWERVARSLKRRMREDRDLLQHVRQAQAVVTGIEVESTETPGGQSASEDYPGAC